MTLAELRRYAPQDSPAWNARLEDVIAAAMHLAHAAREADAPATVADHWKSLPSGDRSLWFVHAWKSVTGRGDA